MEVDGEIRLKDVPENLMQIITARLTVENPKYSQALRMGFPTYNISKKIMLYTIENNQLTVPRGLWLWLWKIRPENTVQHTFTVKLPPVKFDKASFEMRDYQQDVLDSVLSSKHTQGVIVMPCGAGKTETALKLIEELNQPCLWITHTRDLVQGAYGRAVERLGLTRGQICIFGGKKAEIGTHFTVATVQTLYRRDLEEFSQHFGIVIVDECHRVVNNPETASMWAKVLAQLPAKYRFGITATDTRSDGLGETIFHILGDRLAQVSQEVLNQKGTVIVPTVIPFVTDFTYEAAEGEEKLNFQRLTKNLIGNTQRNQNIISHIIKQLDGGHSCLCLASSLGMLREMHSALKAEYPTRFISGATKAAERKATIAQMKNGSAKCLFATYALAKEGLDIPCLDRLFLMTPIRNMTAVQQSVGRIMRSAPNKENAMVFDYVDKRVGVCKSQFYSRKKVYKTLNCNIEKEIIL